MKKKKKETKRVTPTDPNFSERTDQKICRYEPCSKIFYRPRSISRASFKTKNFYCSLKCANTNKRILTKIAREKTQAQIKKSAERRNESLGVGYGPQEDFESMPEGWQLCLNCCGRVYKRSRRDGGFCPVCRGEKDA